MSAFSVVEVLDACIVVAAALAAPAGGAVLLKEILKVIAHELQTAV